jgi:hypothetical protein
VIVAGLVRPRPARPRDDRPRSVEAPDSRLTGRRAGRPLADRARRARRHRSRRRSAGQPGSVPSAPRGGARCAAGGGDAWFPGGVGGHARGVVPASGGGHYAGQGRDGDCRPHGGCSGGFSCLVAPLCICTFTQSIQCSTARRG